MKFDFKRNIFVETNINKEKLAISGSDIDVSWGEFAQNVEKLEKIFKELKIPKGQAVIIYGHKESFYAQAILSLIKSDIPYVPVDEIYPIDRIRKIQSITESQVLINCSNTKLDIEFALEIDNNYNISQNQEAVYSKNISFDKENPLKYIMFTSGSTGEPKGVQISKNNILSFLDWIKKDYNLKDNDVFLNQAPFSFDLSQYEMLSTFMLGASVLLISRKLTSNTDVFFSKLKKYNISVWISTPSFAYTYLREQKYNNSFLTNLKTFIFIGEVLPLKIVKSLKQKFDNSRIINAYGPTEATVATTCVEINEELLKYKKGLPIGYPKRDSEILIDNSTNDNTEEGEIVIVGKHVSKGYFKNDELTHLKFYKHKGKQAFRTGDLGYYKDGMLFFAGRNDDQIKLHGYRIELGEIDTVISNISFIDDAVTIALKRNEEVRRIITFVIPIINFDSENIKEKVIDSINNMLPSYMIPGDVIAIEQFPVNTNHKIDKKKLIDIYRKR